MRESDPGRRLSRRLERVAAGADEMLAAIHRMQQLHARMADLGRQIDDRWSEFHRGRHSSYDLPRFRASLEHTLQAEVERLRAEADRQRRTVSDWVSQARQLLLESAGCQPQLLALARKIEPLDPWVRSPERLRVAVLQTVETLREALTSLQPVFVALPLPAPGGDAVGPLPPKSSLLTVQEAAARLTLAPKTLYRLAASGRIPYVRLGRNVRFRREDLDRWLEARTVRPPGR